MAVLEGLLSRFDARAGPVAALLVGDPGSGKTRLLDELLPRLPRLATTEVVRLRGYELERRIPLATVRSLLQRLRDVPDAGEPVGTLAFGPAPTGGPVDRVRLFEASYGALAGLGPTLVVVDDFHWADEVTAALLHYLLRAAHAAGQPVALVVASRPADGTRSLRESLSDLLGPQRFASVALGPLAEGDGSRLARDLAPGLDDERAALVWRRAEGSPFWMQLLVSQEGADEGVDRVVGDRLLSAGEDAEAVMALLAVTGHPLTLGDVGALYDWPGERVTRAAHGAERAGLAARTTAGVDVAHDLIREAVGRTVSDGRARRLHRLWGRRLEQEAGDDAAALLEALDHLRAGGTAPVPLALRLARSPRRRLLGSAGLSRLVAVADEAATGTTTDDTLFALLGELASELGAHEEAYRIWAGRPSVGRSDAVVARAALRASASATALARHQDARVHLDRARAHAFEDDLLAAEVLTQEAVLQRYGDGDPQSSRLTAARALEMVRAHVGSAGIERVGVDARRAWMGAAHAAMEGALTSDDPELMLALAEELAAVSAGVDDRLMVQALIEGAMALRFLGRNLAAEQRLRHAWDLCQQRVLPESALQVGTTLARVLVSMGRLAEAADLVGECAALGSRVSDVTPVRAFGVTVTWLLELSTGSWQRAAAELRAAAGAEPNPHFRMHAHLERATILSRADPGREEEAVRESVAATLADARAAGCRRCQAEALLRCAQSLARVGDVRVAEDLAARAEVNRVDAHAVFWARWAEATIAAAAHDPGAGDALDGVVVEARRQDMHLEGLWVRLDHARVLLESDRGRAVDVLTRACSDAEQMGATTELGLARRLLRSAGVRAWRRAPHAEGASPVDLLTAREREIARLVATGASNPEIANAVFLSRKTVEHHVSNILTKLGLKSRWGWPR